MAEPRPEGLDFQVSRGDLAETRFETPGPPADPASGHVLLRVDRFALTANNITYATFGDALRYWDFFPAPEGWGRIPAMGFADVIASGHPEVAVGERFFGFYPMSRYLSIEPGKVTAEQVNDAAAHRQGIAPAYQAYARTAADPSLTPEHEDAHMLMRGLFMTSFLIEDLLIDQDRFGARTVVVSSASSKTSIALGWLLCQAGGVHVVGLTSPRNADFVKGLGCYDQVVLYDEVESLAADVPTAFVDMAGNGEVVSRIHRHLGDDLKYSGMVGATHRTAGPRETELPGAKPELFFAPGRMVKRAADWGADGLQQRIGESWTRFRDSSEAWLRVVRGAGRAALEQAYRDTLAGQTPPSEGLVLSLWDEA